VARLKQPHKLLYVEDDPEAAAVCVAVLIDLSIYDADLKLVTCNSKSKQDFAEISHLMEPGTPLKDILAGYTGEGIPLDRQMEIFQSFNRIGRESSEIEGTGIGLTITKRLVEAMDGNIGFESKSNEGSSFWVEFKENEAQIDWQDQMPNEEDQETDIHVNKIEGSILYIEDNPANVMLVQEIVARFTSMQFLSAPNAETGIEIAKRYEPDVILMDINLPGMDGIAALAQIRKIDRISKVHVVALSADAMPQEIARAKNAGFEEYLTKPIKVPGLLDAIKRSCANIS
jgi:CheY-like chemotaxis protein